MNFLQSQKYKLICCLIISTAALLCSCVKEDPELALYKTSMTEFTDTIQGLVYDMESIEGDMTDHSQELLGCLDEMDTAFSGMAALPVPEQFSSIEELADEASANLSRAVSLYHQAFDDPSGYDPGIITAAQEYYSRAFKRLSYIGIIMQGEIPQDENITIIHEGEEEVPEDTPEEAPEEADEVG